MAKKTIQDGNGNNTTRVATLHLSDGIEVQSGFGHYMVGDPSLSETRQGGLGGQDDGVLGVDEGVEKTSLPLPKWGRMTMSECPPFSGFIRVETDYVCKKPN